MSVEKVRTLMAYIKSSHPVNEDLKALCKVKEIAYLAPELDVKTRWNSTYYMLEKFTRMETALNLLAADDLIVHQRYPNRNDRVKIKVCKLCVFFFPIYYTNISSTGYNVSSRTN